MPSDRAEEHRPGTITEALRSEDTGCGIEEYSHGVTKDAAQAWH